MSLDLSSCVSKSTKEKAIKNQNDVALILSKHIFSTKAKHSNTVFSPASIFAALTLVASGPGDSSASDEILSFLRSSSIDELNAVFSEIVSVVFADRSANGGPKITSVNGVWFEQTLRVDSSFKDLFENTFKARFDLVDFRSKAEEVRKELNSWASKHTNGLIKDLLPPGSITYETDCVYGNALYFKGEWEVPFKKSYTRDREFHLLNGTSVSVPFMSSFEKQYIEAYDGFKVLRLPYRQGGDDTNRSSFPYRDDPFGSSFLYAQGGDDANGSFFPYGQGGDDPFGRSLPYGQSGDDTFGRSLPYGQGGDDTVGRSLPYGQGGDDTFGRSLPYGQGSFFPYGQGGDDAFGSSLPYGQGGDDTFGRSLPYGQGGDDPFGRSLPYGQGGDDTFGRSLLYGQGGDDVNGSFFPYGQGGDDAFGSSLPYGQGGDDANRSSFTYLQRCEDAYRSSFPCGQGGDDTNRKFSMYFYLPNKKDGLDDLVKTMASTSGFLDSHVPSWKVLVNEFRIPKFKIADGLNGEELGFRSMPLYHKACVEIDEEGAEAAAATFAIATSGCPMYMEPPKRIDFVADHPFLFLIREDKTGTVLFVGQIFDPSNKSS